MKILCRRGKIRFTNLYREHRPPAALAPWVECFWSIEVTVSVAAAPVRPDGCVDFVFSPATGLLAVGAMTSQQCFDQVPGASPCGIRFRPGMARDFLGVSADELTDLSVSLESVLGRGARELEQRLLNTHNPVLLLAEWLDVPAAPPSPIQQAIAAMVRANGQVNLERIAEQAGLSPRHFRRRCLEESGLTPRHLARVLRFRHALALGAQSRRNWASIAAEAGYFDQAHMIRDFREFTGSTPMAVFSNPELHAVL